MAESNELNFGNLENSNDVIENNLDDVTQNQDEPQIRNRPHKMTQRSKR